MAIQVNPPPQHNIPKKILNDKELRDYFIYQQEYLFKLWLRTGGGDDSISSIENGELYEPGIQTSDSEELETELDPFETLPGGLFPVEVISVADSYTTTGDQILICTNASDITVTLNATPDDGEQVHIKKAGDGMVTVSGTVDGQATTDIIFKYDSPHLVYTLEAGEWSII